MCLLRNSPALQELEISVSFILLIELLKHAVMQLLYILMLIELKFQNLMPYILTTFVTLCRFDKKMRLTLLEKHPIV